MDAAGRMDVPKKDTDVAWYNLGYRPGEKGGAVIDGHLDKASGAPAVFWDLKKLSPGDELSVTDANGHQLTFAVVRTVSYAWNQLPIKEVFGASSVPMLNLITCQGTWDTTKKNYSNRMVVYAQLKEGSE
jgi:sortase (surface protein transpeptidase)